MYIVRYRVPGPDVTRIVFQILKSFSLPLPSPFFPFHLSDSLRPGADLTNRSNSSFNIGRRFFNCRGNKPVRSIGFRRRNAAPRSLPERSIRNFPDRDFCLLCRCNGCKLDRETVRSFFSTFEKHIRKMNERINAILYALLSIKRSVAKRSCVIETNLLRTRIHVLNLTWQKIGKSPQAGETETKDRFKKGTNYAKNPSNERRFSHDRSRIKKPSHRVGGSWFVAHGSTVFLV